MNFCLLMNTILLWPSLIICLIYTIKVLLKHIFIEQHHLAVLIF